MQPPSGGCVLKQQCLDFPFITSLAATFGWLCVETTTMILGLVPPLAATFGWLCVETLYCQTISAKSPLQPPSGGCVLKLIALLGLLRVLGSHLRVAVC